MTVVVEGSGKGSEVAEEVAEDIVEAATETAEAIVDAAVEVAETIVDAATDAGSETGTDAEIDRWVENEARHAEHERRISELAERSWSTPSREEVVDIAEAVVEEVVEEVTSEIDPEASNDDVTIVVPDVTEGKRKRRSWKDVW